MLEQKNIIIDFSNIPGEGGVGVKTHRMILCVQINGQIKRSTIRFDVEKESPDSVGPLKERINFSPVNTARQLLNELGYELDYDELIQDVIDHVELHNDRILATS